MRFNQDAQRERTNLRFNRGNAIGLMVPPALIALFTLLAPVALAQTSSSKSVIQFNRDIRPILADHCLQCHGPDKTKRKGDLRLDTKQGAFADTDGNRAVVPGKLDKSELYKRIVHSDVTERMPPKKFGNPLKPAQIDLLKRWIQQGAPWQEHWAFTSVTRPQAPKVKQTSWPRNQIDRFILAKLESRGLKPASEAEKTTLIRRVTLDLTGLTPTLAQIDAYLGDKSPMAYEKVVDRLLASPQYGEHMARFWLDASRYADTNGYQYDKERTQWAWRDWVIHAYNTNMPFNQFTIEQLAGDLLPDSTPAQKLATGFNRNHPITIEGGVIDEEYRTEYVIDRVTTMSTVWLGLTMICSRCHDHKFDPISQQEFYQFFAFFNQVPERGLNGFDPRMKAPLVLQAGGTKELDKQITALQGDYDRRIKQLDAAQAQWEKKASGQAKPIWTVVKPIVTRSLGGAKLTLQADNSVLASGKNPAKETYEVTIQTELADVRAVRLEAMTHPSLPFKSASRGKINGNFVLSEFQMTAKPAAKKGGEQTVKFTAARADYSQQGWNISKAIDGNAATGWAVDGNRFRVNRTAVFVTDKSVGASGKTELRITMRFNYGSSHQIGRFRIALSSDPNADATGGGGTLDLLAIPAAKRTPAQKKQLRDYYVAKHGPPEIRKIQGQLGALRKQRNRVSQGGPSTLIMVERPGMRKTHLLYRGEYNQPRQEVKPGVPAVFPPMPKGAPVNRLGLAKWITDPANPLTARVIVNRYWQRYFGTGIVKTVEDFGTRAAAPSHPQLLDWLAADFVRTGWDVKAMQKTIVSSAAYRQSSRISAQAFQMDPTNRLIARGPRGRLDAETIRDSVLSISGLLIDRQGGPSVYPYHPQGLWQELNNRPGYSKTYPHQKDGQQLYRRSLYTFWKRTVPPPSLAAFDAPEREFCVVSRSATNTPLQAFVLMNDPQFVEAARHLAGRIMTKGGKTFEDRIAYGLRLALARKPVPAEIAVYKDLFNTQLAKFTKDKDAAAKLLAVGVSPPDGNLETAQYAAWTTIARVILNLSETINKG